MTTIIQKDALHFATSGCSEAGDNNCIHWTNDITQLFTVVEWCLNIEWLFHHSTCISKSQRLKLADSARTFLDKTRTPTYNHVHQTLVKPALGGGKAKIAPEPTQQQTRTQSLECWRNVNKWKYSMCSGKTWSLRNRGGRRGYPQFLQIWMLLYETIQEANNKGINSLACRNVEVAMLAKDLNELSRLMARGRHNDEAVTEFCCKVMDEAVLKRVKCFVDECRVL